MEIQRGSEWRGESPGGGRPKGPWVQRAWSWPRAPQGLGPKSLGPQGLGSRAPRSTVHRNNQPKNLGPGHVVSHLILLNGILS